MLSQGLILLCRSFRLSPWCCIEWPSAYLKSWLPCIWMTALQRLICVIKVVQCLFFFPGWPARYWVWPTSTVLLISAYIPTHLNADYLSSWGQMLSEWHLFPQVAQAAFHLWGVPDVDLLASSHTVQCQCYYTLESPLPLGALGLNAFNHPWMFQLSYVFPHPALVPLVLSKFLAEHVKGQPQTFDSDGTKFDGGSMASTVLSMLADALQWCPIIKDLIMGCFGRPCAQGSVISAFNPLAAQRCVLHRQGFSSSVCQAVVGATWASTSKVYHQCWKEWACWVCMRRCTKQCHICH